MKHRDLLEMLADYLEKKVSEFDFNMSNTQKDALYYATRIPAFKRAGFILAHNDNDPRRKGESLPSYKGEFEIAAAMKFFDLDVHEAQHLFGAYEQDPWGYSEPSIFHENDPDHPKSSRVKEPPQWCAQRLRVYARKGKDAYIPFLKDVRPSPA